MKKQLFYKQLFALLSHLGNVLAHHIKLNIDQMPNLKLMKYSMFIGVWNNGNTKSMPLGTNHCQACTIYTNGTFFNGDIFRVFIVFKTKQPTAVLVFNVRACSYFINVPLNQMAV